MQAEIDDGLYGSAPQALPFAPAIEVRAFLLRRDRGNPLVYSVDGDDFAAIPIPGHTPGATAHLWEGGGHRMLFTGDSVFLDDGEWVAAVLGSSDRARRVESLGRIRELDFDVLVPWAATGGQAAHAITDGRTPGAASTPSSPGPPGRGPLNGTDPHPLIEATPRGRR